MKIHNTQKYNSFGWNFLIHKRITLAALKHMPSLSEYKTPIVAGAMFPDFHLHYANFLSKTHCYHGEKNIYNCNRGVNALDTYRQNLQSSVVDWAFDDEYLAMQDIGKALHILQDMADPVHTQPKMNKLSNIQNYKLYEQEALKQNIDEIMNGAPLAATTNNFYDLFGDTYQKSACAKNPLSKKSKENLTELVRQYLSESCSATIAFLKRLNNLQTMTTSNQCIAISNESISSNFLQKLSN